MSLYFRKSKPLPLAFLEKMGDIVYVILFTLPNTVVMNLWKKQLINGGANTKK